MNPSSQHALSFWPLLAMVVSVQLGSAMFMVPNQLAPFGGWCFGGWFLAGAGALALCRVLAHLAIRYPLAGGPHIYIAHAFGHKVAFYVGWTYWILVWLASVPLMLLTLDAWQRLTGLPLSMALSWGLQGAILWLLVRLNSRGAVLAGWCETVLMVCKGLPLLMVPLLTLPYWSWNHMVDTSLVSSPLASIQSSALYAFWCFVGLEAGTTLTPWAKNPTINLPKALFWGTLLVLGVYVLNTGSVLGTVPSHLLVGRCDGYGQMVLRCLGPQWAWVMDVGMIIVCVGSLNSWILAGGQMLASGGQSGLFPAWVAQQNRYHSPAVAVGLTALCLGLGVMVCSAARAAAALEAIITLASALYLIIYLMCAGAMVVLCRRHTPCAMSWLTKGCTAICGLVCGGILLSIPWTHLVASLIFPLSGWIFCRIWGWEPRAFHHDLVTDLDAKS